MRENSGSGVLSVLRSESAFLIGAVTTVLFFIYGEAWLADLIGILEAGLHFVWIFAVMLWCAFGVVRHADCLAELLGEPYGTLILTIAVISIEVALISAIMLNGDSDPTLARDTMLAVLMIVLNGMVGLALLIGGLRHGEQDFNLQGAKAYLAVILPLATISLILPRFTISSAAGELSPMKELLFAVMTVVLYGTFLAIQTKRHRAFFTQPATNDLSQTEPVKGHGHSGHEPRSVPYHALFLVLTMLPIVLLSKKLAVVVDHGIATLGAPAALGGILVAILVLTPEGLAAFHATLENKLQRSVNICLGSALATIGLTVPAVLMIDLFTGLNVVLGLDHANMVLLVLTLLLSMLTFGGGRTNMLQGAVHLVVFIVYLVLIFNP